MFQSILNMNELDLYKYHEHHMKECDCNLYGEYIMKEMSKNCPFKLPLFLLKFKILYNKLNLHKSSINTEWNTDITKSVPYEINKFNVQKFEQVLKCFDPSLTFQTCLDIDNHLLYVLLNDNDYKTVNMNYPTLSSSTLTPYFEYITKGGKTYLPKKHVENCVHQLNTVISILDKIITNKQVLNSIDFASLNQLAETISDTYLNGLLSNTKDYHIVKDVAFIDSLYECDTNFTQVVKEFYGLYQSSI